MNFKDVKNVFFESSFVEFLFVRKVGSFGFFVEDKPFPIFHGVGNSVMIDFLLQRCDFVMILFGFDPLIFETHEDLGLK